MSQSVIEVRDVAYSLPDGRVLFSSLNATFGPERTGIVGANGVGKSTFLRLLTREIQPVNGVISGSGALGYLPQSIALAPNMTVAGALGLEPIVQAQRRIEQGCHVEGDAETAQTGWSLIARAEQGLAQLGLSHIGLDDAAARLSGGERTRIAFLRVMLADPRHLVLDEPTNHLDRHARLALRQVLDQWRGGVICVSHDRELLGRVDRILELTEKGFVAYGGGFAFYEDQRDRDRAALERDLARAKSELRKLERAQQKEKEKHDRRSGSGRRRAKREGASKIEIGAARERSTQTGGRLGKLGAARMDGASDNLRAIEGKALKARLIPAFDIAEAPGRRTRYAVSASNVGLAFAGRPPLFERLSFTVAPGERVAICGPNGSGKSSLLKMIKSELAPTAGELHVGARAIAYLDQHPAQVLDPGQTVLENFLRHNPALTHREAHDKLALLQFRNTAALKKAGDLSGGEQLRAALAALLMGGAASDLLLLDEPTNNLDLESIESLEAALSACTSAIIVVSHDEVFLERIGVQHRVELQQRSPASE